MRVRHPEMTNVMHIRVSNKEKLARKIYRFPKKKKKKKKGKPKKRIIDRSGGRVIDRSIERRATTLLGVLPVRWRAC
jgi:hypothetical protein